MQPEFTVQNVSQGHVAEHVFVIDDDEGMRNTIRITLELLGYVVHAFEDPRSFLENDLIQAPAVVITDMRMPGMTGVDLQAELLARGRNIPLVFVSGQSSLEQGLVAMKQGALEFLIKPFSREDLIRAVVKGIAQDVKRLQSLNNQEKLALNLKNLTNSELEIYKLLLKGYNNNELVQATGLTLYTAKNYKAKVMQKMGVKSLAELMRQNRL
jgi:two-component system response regulator FixJ